MIASFIERFTYVGLFLTLLLAGLGLPIPEEVPVLTAGVLAHEHLVRWWIALPVCLAGVISGDVALYWSGRHWGRRILGWALVRRVLTPEREKSLESSYHRHGAKILFTARHIVGLRAAAFLTAGIAGIPFWKFLTVDAAAALVGVPFGFGVAYVFTDHLADILADAHRIERWVGLVVLLALVGGLLVTLWRRSREL